MKITIKKSEDLQNNVNVRKKRIISIATEERSHAKVQIVYKKCAELTKHKENIRTILMCSNATPIRRYVGVGFMCCFCPQQYPDAALLKTHTIQSHGEAEKKVFLRAQALPSFVVKLDITGLTCSLCNTPFSILDDFTTHLVTSHNRTFHEDIKSHIIPFKFANEEFRCVICSTKFNNFKILHQHMNQHFGNHVCEICGRGFVNLRVFQTHMYRHSTGVYKCSICDKVFDNRVKCKDHERQTHKLMHKRNKCGYCCEKFKDYVKKNSHEVNVHGAKPVVLNCLACDRSFDNQRALTVHTKSHHMMEKRPRKS